MKRNLKLKVLVVEELNFQSRAKQFKRVNFASLDSHPI